MEKDELTKVIKSVNELIPKLGVSSIKDYYKEIVKEGGFNSEIARYIRGFLNADHDERRKYNFREIALMSEQQIVDTRISYVYRDQKGTVKQFHSKLYKECCGYYGENSKYSKKLKELFGWFIEL